MQHYRLDHDPIPNDGITLYANEPWLIDKTLAEESPCVEPDDQEDNIRIYVPMDLNRDAILRRLDAVIIHYGMAEERNEMNYRFDVNMIIAQLEIYDQVWCDRHKLPEGTHSREAILLAKEMVACLEEIPLGCSECFPFETIEELKQEFFPD